MKIAVTATGSDPKNDVEPRFGRAPWFLFYDMESGAWEAADNSGNTGMAHGAGLQTAETVARKGATAVITGHCGPKAMEALAAAGVRVYLGDARTAEEAVKAFQAGQLREISEPNGPRR